ncbi:uncharacterized protein TNCV_2751411 [Trichonephila clavipes]|nr:uncharacterized protein TNCV_2751411 [Trichonephila clavipes]
MKPIRRDPMSPHALRKMIQKFEATGQLGILPCRGLKHITSSIIKNVATAVVEANSQSPDEIKPNGVQICSVSLKRYNDTRARKDFVSPEIQQRGCLQNATFMKDGASPPFDCRVKDLLKQHFIDARVISCHFSTALSPHLRI